MSEITLIHGDCMEHIARYDDNYFDLAIVDPPYGIGECGKTNKSRGKLAKAKDYVAFAGEDKEPPPPEYFYHLKRISKNQIIFGANHFIDLYPYRSSCWVVWDKDNGSSDFADCELAYTSFNTAVRIFKYRWSGMLQENMKQKEQRIHPTQKPIALYKWLLKNYAKPGQRVLDTHLGSGSSAIAAHYFGCDFVGIEKSEHYYKAAKERFNKSTRQLALF